MARSTRPILIVLAVLILAFAAWLAFGAGNRKPPSTEGIRFVEGDTLPGANVSAAQPAPVAPAVVASPTIPARMAAESPGVGDDLAAQMLPPEADDPRTLYKRVRAEATDAEWAPRAEQAIKGSYAGIPYIGTTADPLRIRCGASICEVAGATASDLSSENTNVAWQALQGKALSETLAKNGLEVKSSVFGGAGKKSTFVTYLVRK